MHLTKFKATNFRSVVDSTWIEADRVTALIGVNESGKTNLLLPLWKFNPAREGEIKPTSDYPKGNFGPIRADPGAFDFVEVEFDITDLAETLATLSGVASKFLDVVRVSRNFAGDYTYSFPKHVPTKSVSRSEVEPLLEAGIAEISALSPLAKEGGLKAELLKALEQALAIVKGLAQVSAADCQRIAADLSLATPETPASTSSIVPRFAAVIEAVQVVEARINMPAPSSMKDVKALIEKHLPRFVYYSNYGNLDSEIYLPHVVDNLNRKDLGAREAAKARTLRVLFSFVGLSPAEILELGKDFDGAANVEPTEEEIEEIATKKRERTILLNSAATDLTKKFRDWWKQGDYTFEFQADGDHFRIWVSDSKRPEKVELEDRSTGLQWFLSFYLVFLVESRRDHRNAILLLDEPGLSLHPLAQRDLSTFFENLAATNQIVYTTHSPFLVDADMLDRVRKVFVSEDGSTKASSDLRRGSDDPRSSGATYAIHSALNMNVAESILYGCHPVIVEGPSDQHYLSLIKTILVGEKRINPKREIVFPPAHGAGNAKVIASILTGKDETFPFIFLDSDSAGNKMARDLQNGLYQSEKNKVLQTGAYVKFSDSEIEDLFPAEFLADAVDRWGRKADVRFADGVVIGTPIIPQIESWAAQQNVKLDDGWKVQISREAKKLAFAKKFKGFPEEVLSMWTKLFTDLLREE